MADATLKERAGTRHASRAAATASAEQLRFHRLLLACAGGAYLVWWGFVRVALPDAFNPLFSRLLVVACFALVLAASYVSKAIADRSADALALCCAIATAHYFYLLERNAADLNWVVGSYITITAVCAILQTARSLLFYSVLVALSSVVLLLRIPSVSFVVFVPGTLTILLFANVGLHRRLAVLAELQDSHKRIEALFDAGFEGIAVEHEGVIREVNGALARMVGQAREQVIGRQVGEILAATEPGIAAGDDAPREAQLLRIDGTRTAVEVMTRPHVVKGQSMRLLAIRDLTRRKEAEEALKLANRELESFSYSVAHDLRTPLRTIDGFSQIVLEDHGASLDPKAQKYLQTVRTEAQRMGEIIDDLLELAQVSRAELSRQRIDLSLIATHVVERLRSATPTRDVACSIQPGIVVDADRRLLQILLENLIGNAWKFTATTRDARIAVTARVEPEGEVISISDNGVGFDMAFSKKLFIAFQRLHPNESFPGTGIGLATVQRIVDRHGGRVWAVGSVDEGAAFHLTLHAPGRRPHRITGE